MARADQWLDWGSRACTDYEREAAVKDYDDFVKQDPSPVEAHDIEQVDKDVHRTYPDVEGFNESENLERLRRILMAIAHHHEGGYAQSMNYIAAVVMTQLKYKEGIREGDMFWLIMVIFQCLPNYHDRSLSGAQTDSRVLSELLAQAYPEAAAIFEKNGLTPDLFFVEWLLGVMTSAVSIDTVISVFDVLFKIGRPGLLRACVAIMAWCFTRLPENGSLMEIKEISMQCTPEEVKSILQMAEQDPVASDEQILDLYTKHSIQIQQEVIYHL